MEKNLFAVLLCALLLTGCRVGNITFNYIESPDTAPAEPAVTQAPAPTSPVKDTTEPEVNPDTTEPEPLYLELYEHLNQGETEFTLNIPQGDDSLLLFTQRMKKEHPDE